jgi:uncharacterized membrane protein YhfC
MTLSVLLAMTLSVLFRLTDSGYLVGILKHFVKTEICLRLIYALAVIEFLLF